MAKRKGIINEDEEGGFVKNPSRRPRRREDDENRPARKREQRVEGGLAGLADPDVQKSILGRKRPSVKTTPPPPVVKKKEEKMQNVSRTPRTFMTQDTESCPVCGYRKPTEITVRTRDGETRVRPLVCKGCSDRYHAYATGPEMVAKLAAGEPVVVLTRHQWVYSQLDLVAFEQELKAAAAEKDRLNGLVQTRIKAAGFLPRETFQSLRDKLQAEPLPGETTTARQAYGTWRRLEERLKAARIVRPEVEKMVADEAAKNSTPATTAQTTTDKPAAKKTVKPKKGK